MVAAGAVAVGMLAASGFAVYKTVQLATGGKVEVRFAESEISANTQVTLSQLRKIAVWPSPDPYSVVNWWPRGDDIRLTELLQRYGYFAIATPNTVQKVANSRGIATDLSQLTQNERLDAFQAVANELGVDGIIAFSLGSWGYDMKPFSFKRGEGTIAFSVVTYSTLGRNLAWEQDGQFAIIGGRKTIFSKPEGEEMQGILVTAVAEKFLRISGVR